MISVTVLTQNSKKHIKEVLTSLQGFKEVVVCDTGSTDDTLSIAETFPNVTIHSIVLKGFGPMHNEASSLAKGDWILSIDSDEVVTRELAEEILGLKLNPDCVYSFPRHNYFNEKWIKWCGWYPDRQFRLYHKRNTCFTDDWVHEGVVCDKMKRVSLKNGVKHYSYSTIDDFLIKMQSYSKLFAEQNRGKKSSSLLKAIGHGFFAFFKSYFLQRGFLGGKEGFVISSYQGHTAFYKYLKLAEANQQKR